jgi:hypothetical protein
MIVCIVFTGPDLYYEYIVCRDAGAKREREEPRRSGTGRTSNGDAAKRGRGAGSGTVRFSNERSGIQGT